MFKQIFIIFFLILPLFADYNNISLKGLLKKVAFLNNINIVIPEDVNFTNYTLTINKRISNKDLLGVAKTLLKEQGYFLKKQNNFFLIEKIPPTPKSVYTALYKAKNTSASMLVSYLKNLFPNAFKIINNKYIYITTDKKSTLNKILSLLPLLDTPIPTYYAYIKIYDIDTNYLKEVGINIPTVDLKQGNIVLNKTINTNLLPAVINALETSKKAKLIASPMLILTPSSKPAVFKEGMNIPIKIKQATITNGTNPLVKEVNKIVYKDVGLQLTLTYKRRLGGNKIEFKLDLLDTNVLTTTEDSITTTKREISAIIQATINKPIFIAGLGRKSKKEEIKGIPLLKNIPVLGVLFSHKSNTTTNRTLLITLIIREQNE